MPARARVTEGNYYPAVDGLRTVAVLAVIGFHGARSVLPGGFLGVDVFFVISGFVITLTLLREYDRTGTFSLRQFYRRRWWRLMPALVLMLVLSAALEVAWKYAPVGRWAGEAATALTYTYNLSQAATDHNGIVLNHTWSLGVEEQFYLAWAPVMLWGLHRTGTRASRLRLLGAAIVGLALLRIITAVVLGAVPAFFLPWCRMDQLLIGAALAVALHRNPAGKLATPFRSMWPAAVAAAVLIVALFSVHDLYGRGLEYGGLTGLALLAALLVGHAYVPTVSPLRTALGSAPMAWLGQRSYGIYLFHFPVVVALRAHGVDAGWHAPVSFAVAVVLAALSFRYVEAPIRRYAHRPKTLVAA